MRSSNEEEKWYSCPHRLLLTQGYALTILVDGSEENVTDTVERYVFRPSILRSFGWQVLDIPGRDWIENPDTVIARVEAILADGEDSALHMELDIDEPALSAALTTLTTAPAKIKDGINSSKAVHASSGVAV